jgi:hypothetical protein
VPTKLIGTEKLDEIIETSFLTSQISKAIPVSLFLVADSGTGKSKSILRHDVPWSLRMDDLTSSGLLDVLEKDPENRIRFVVIGDLNAVLAHRSSVMKLTFGNLLTLMSDGTAQMADGAGKKDIKHLPIGLIVAITRQMYLKNYNAWDETGFLRRFVPIYFEYSLAMSNKIQIAISKQKVTSEPLIQTKLEPIPEFVKDGSLRNVILPQEMANRIMVLSDEWSSKYLSFAPIRKRDMKTKKIKYETGIPYIRQPFHPHLVLQTMCKAHALWRDRKAATAREEDFEFLHQFVQFTRFDRPYVLDVESK